MKLWIDLLTDRKLFDDWIRRLFSLARGTFFKRRLDEKSITGITKNWISFVTLRFGTSKIRLQT